LYPAQDKMDELEQLQETIFREIQRTEKAMHDTNLREDTDRGSQTSLLKYIPWSPCFPFQAIYREPGL
jgi:hypothetical protein